MMEITLKQLTELLKKFIEKRHIISAIRIDNNQFTLIAEESKKQER